jgi:hypothetical protein
LIGQPTSFTLGPGKGLKVHYEELRSMVVALRSRADDLETITKEMQGCFVVRE